MLSAHTWKGGAVIRSSRNDISVAVSQPGALTYGGWGSATSNIWTTRPWCFPARAVWHPVDPRSRWQNVKMIDYPLPFPPDTGGLTEPKRHGCFPLKTHTLVFPVRCQWFPWAVGFSGCPRMVSDHTQSRGPSKSITQMEWVRSVTNFRGHTVLWVRISAELPGSWVILNKLFSAFEPHLPHPSTGISPKVILMIN